MDLNQLILKIGGDSTGAEAALGRVNKSTVNLGSIVKSIIAGAAVAAMVKWTETTINLGIEAEKAGALLDATMKHTLNSTNEQVAACKSWAENQEKVNHFDAELLMAQLDKGIVKYNDLGTAQVAVSAAQEVARLKGIDVASAYSLVEQASNGMARSLKQFGIEAVAGTSQLSYLQQILDKTSGSTEAYNKTTAGMIGAMKQAYEVMRETLGQALLPIVNTLMKQLSPIIENLTSYIIANMPTIESKVASVCSGIASAFEAARPVLDAVWNTMSWIIKNAGTAIDWINRTRAANETRAATNASAGDDFNITGMLTPNPGTNSVGTPLNITGGRGTINRGVVGAVAEVKNLATAYTGAAVAAVDMGVSGTKASTTVADAAKKAATATADAARAAAEAIKQARQGVADKIYALTHTELETELRIIAQERDASIAAGVPKLEAIALYNAEKAKLLKDSADAAKKIEEQETADFKSELEKKTQAQNAYYDALNRARDTMNDKIYNMTHNPAEVAARNLSSEISAGAAAGIEGGTLEQYVKATFTSYLSGVSGTYGAAAQGVEAFTKAFPWLASGESMNNTAVLSKLDAVIAAITRIAPSVGLVINGVGRSA